MTALDTSCIFLLLVISINIGGNDVKTPYGPWMCANLCAQYGSCTCPMLEPRLTCRIDSGHVKHACLSIFQKNFNQTGREQSVPTGHRLIKNHRQQHKVITVKANTGDCDIPWTAYAPSSRSCRVPSLAASPDVPGLLYLLQDCQLGRTHHTDVLSFLFFNTRRVLNNSLQFCSRKSFAFPTCPCYGRSQIFMGSSLRDSGTHSLYSITVARKQLYVATYRQPATTDTKLEETKFNHKKKFKAGVFTCSFFSVDVLLCIMDDELYKVKLGMHSPSITLTKLGITCPWSDVKELRLYGHLGSTTYGRGIIVTDIKAVLVRIHMDGETQMEELKSWLMTVKSSEILDHDFLFLTPTNNFVLCRRI